jgi:cell division inhibitor SulA
MNPALQTLLDHPALWRGDALAQTQPAEPTGFAELDALLPGGGWPRGALTELLLDHEGIGELRLTIPLLAALTAAGGWVALIAPPYLPYAPALSALGVDLSRLIVLKAAALEDRWWAAEQAMRAGSLGAVLFWPGEALDAQRLRRLQLALQAGGGVGFVFAPAAHRLQPSPAPLRLALAPGAAKLRLDILKRRGGPVEAPLWLDVAALSARSLRQPPARAGERVPPLFLRPHLRNAPRRAKSHANGGDSRRIWDRAIARADEVRRSVIPTRG